MGKPLLHTPYSIKLLDRIDRRFTETRCRFKFTIMCFVQNTAQLYTCLGRSPRWTFFGRLRLAGSSRQGDKAQLWTPV